MRVWPAIAGLPVAQIAPCRSGAGSALAATARHAARPDVSAAAEARARSHRSAAQRVFARTRAQLISPLTSIRDPAFGQSPLVQQVCRGGAVAGSAQGCPFSRIPCPTVWRGRHRAGIACGELGRGSFMKPSRACERIALPEASWREANRSDHAPPAGRRCLAIRRRPPSPATTSSATPWFSRRPSLTIPASRLFPWSIVPTAARRWPTSSPPIRAWSVPTSSSPTISAAMARAAAAGDRQRRADPGSSRRRPRRRRRTDRAGPGHPPTRRPSSRLASTSQLYLAASGGAADPNRCAPCGAAPTTCSSTSAARPRRIRFLGAATAQRNWWERSEAAGAHDGADHARCRRDPFGLSRGQPVRPASPNWCRVTTPPCSAACEPPACG